MDHDNPCPLLQFRDTVIKLKTELEEFSLNHNSNKEATYNERILPHLCELRKLNRLTKDASETTNKTIEQLDSKLIQLQDQVDNITFEAQCLNHEVVAAKNRLSPTKTRANHQDGDAVHVESNGNDMSFFDIDKVGQMDHQTRLGVLESEETRRRALQEKLAEVKTETNEIDLICQASEGQLNRIKPYIKQLLDKVDLGEPIRNEKKD